MIDRQHYFFDDLKDMETKEILSGFVKQFYMGELEYPNKIMLQEEIEDKEVVEEWLSNKAGRKVEIKTPQKGEKLRLDVYKRQGYLLINDKKNWSQYVSEKIIDDFEEIRNISVSYTHLDVYI